MLGVVQIEGGKGMIFKRTHIKKPPHRKTRRFFKIGDDILSRKNQYHLR